MYYPFDTRMQSHSIIVLQRSVQFNIFHLLCDVFLFFFFVFVFVVAAIL